MRASGQIHWNVSFFFVFSGGSDQSERDDPGLGQRHRRAALQRHRWERQHQYFWISTSVSDSPSCKKVDCVMWETTRGMTWLHQVEASCVVSVPAPPKTIRAVIQQQSLPLTQAFSLKSQFISELFGPLIRLGGVVSAVHWSEHCLSYEQPTKASKVCFFLTKMLVLNFSQQQKRHLKAIFFKRCVTFILFNQVLSQKVNADVFMWLFYV